MAKLHVQDKKGELAKIARKVLRQNKSFRVLKKIEILWVWRLGETPRYDDEGNLVAAQTRKLPNRERDLYGFDVEVEVFKQTWRKRGMKAKRRLIYHELRHIEVEVGENFKVNYDDDGRIIINIVPHDVYVATFEDEIKKYGLAGHDVNQALVLSKALRKLHEKKKEKKQKSSV